ncbi:tRNA uridine(34) 5-carboxymethylaminomethyl modification radical SAM/GNAT enzyme Elp3 [Nitrososphaera viennensis]|uniref:Elongator complex protein 3 n=3 Tax=Nitrososphaera viennensis TaxID=1034015 RepID=A0A060HK81_9ARCH|nr:tRNA uridine(34) 5-carboxymethylaminomethyl modification radical SAM/GNAT enzyme Elp3 [Nitrososphaera viennensis]AIC15705.1 histone acetyltransferase, ELP3 family [Nitrososphaera viennensis EN76]UVS70578.1 tRNA uridine(34) 5-carboxymethylaminomethyl modification radical SAM/GNAT enzyme Elp3 [Nitrososphaera viennensis]
MLSAAADSDPNYQQACRTIAMLVVEKQQQPLSAGEVRQIVRDVSSSFHLSTMPKNAHIISYLPKNSRYRKLLMVKPAKTASGVAVIAVMPKPYECPHGKCIYCPGGIEFNTPLSYTGTEPATRAAQKFQFDPYEQVSSKMKQLQSRGHDTGKSELVIVGGTFPFMPEDYQREFAKSCYDALNGSRSKNLQEAMAANERAENRCVGFTVETKPDYCKEPHVDLMLELGVTRVEIGVQSLRDNVYKLVNRGHTLDDVIDSFRITRDSGYKIVAHMMPGLPGSSPEKDIADFKRLFEDEAFKPDMLKVYPTLVLEHTGLYKLYSSGKYCAYSDDDLVDVIVEMKKMVPQYVRIMRVQREIESDDIIAGPKSGNLRQIVLARLKKQGHDCTCIRCREAGLQKRYPAEDEVVMKRTDYAASGGREIFLSYESADGKTILGFLRLRKVNSPHRQELQNVAIVRELHVYGQALGVGLDADSSSYQHRGYGTKLMQEAERIAKDELGAGKIAVISAVGTREYYKTRLGYRQDGPYVSKVL